MNWRKRKKRNRIIKHYGFDTYKEYEFYLRYCATFREYTERGWFSDTDRPVMAYHTIALMPKFTMRFGKKQVDEGAI